MKKTNVDLAELYAVLHRMEYLLGAIVALLAAHTGTTLAF